jgi:hypothetical protein
MCKPHCWQYAKFVGVAVPQRGHVIVAAPPCDGRPPDDVPKLGGDAFGPPGGANAGFGVDIGIGDAIGPPGGGAIIGAPPAGPPKCGEPGVVCPSVAPQFRQNFIPGGFSPLQVPHLAMPPGNPPPVPGVDAGAAASAVPQFKQNDDPGGLWCPQTEQRSITPLFHRVSRKGGRE